MTDYTIFYRRSMTLDQLTTKTWTTVVSAYNGSERVQKVFSHLNAQNRHWILHKEYCFERHEWPSDGTVFAPESLNEADFLSAYFSEAGDVLLSGSLCIDITGFMRPHLLLLARMLKDKGVTQFDAIYAEPSRYVSSENTTFTDGPVEEVRQVAGFEGVHVPETESSDLLIIGAGYDDRLVQWVAESKRHAKKRLMYGLPSLQPDMYQQGRLRIANAADAIGPAIDADLLFAPANNPFVTAQTLSEAVMQEKHQGKISNLYLSPLGTKAQVLGFGIFYLQECIGSSTSMIFPFATRYSRETSKGLSRIMVYSVDLN